MTPSERQHPGLEMLAEVVGGLFYFWPIQTADNQEKQYLFVVHV